jgi:hypothetical protein
MKKKQFYDPVYENEFLVLWDVGEEDAAAALKLTNRWLDLGGEESTPLEPDDIASAAYCICTQPDGSRYVLWFSSTSSPLELLSWVCHETLHAAQHVFNHCSIEWDTGVNKQEPQCYYQTYLFRETVKAMNLDLPNIPIEGKVES